MKNSTIPTGRPKNIELAFYERSGQHAVRYVSATTVCEEILENTRMVGLSWSASGHVVREVGPGRGKRRETLDASVYPTTVFELEIDGQTLLNCWDWVSAYERPGGKPGTVEGVVELRHQVRPITVKVVTRLDGSAILVRWLEITNTGAASCALSHVSPCAGVLWNMAPSWNPSVDREGSRYSLGYMRSERRAEEGDFVWVPLPEESYRVERTQGTNYGQPYFVLRNDVTGEYFFVGLAWSRNWFAEFTYKNCLALRGGVLGSEFEAVLSLRIGPLGPAPLRVIAAGETVASPEVHLGPVHAGFDAAVQAWQQHMRASVVPPRPEGKEMYTIMNHVVEYPGEWILREADIAAELGIQAFMVDAGWYGSEFGGWVHLRGDWVEGDWLPAGGLAGIRDYVHRKGMIFGLWMEPEQAGDQSKLIKEHPDWVLATDNGRKIGNPVSWALNLGKPEVAKFAEDEAIRLIRDLKLDFFKIDYNLRVYEGGQNLRDGYLEQESWRHCEVLYGIFDRVRRECPQVALETCAGGGGRNDLGMMSRFHYACESDLSWMPLSIRAINGLSLFLPPEAICYYHNHITHAHLMADLDTHMRVCLFATAIFVGFGAQDADHNTEHFNTIKRYIRLAKEFCYPIMGNRALVYHHTPDIGVSQPADWCVLEYAAPDRSRGYAGVFALREEKGSRDYTLRLRGVERARTYRVTLDNVQDTFTASGRELADGGLVLHLDSGLTSELVLYQVVD